MQKLDYIHFDSFYSIDTLNDSFDTTFILNQKYQNINKVYFKNIELPLGFVNIRSSNNSNDLRLILNGKNLGEKYSGVWERGQLFYFLASVRLHLLQINEKF